VNERDQSIPEIPSKAEGGPQYAAPPMQCEATRLMLAVKYGDAQAFDTLVESLRGRAFHVARALVGSHDDAMELRVRTHDRWLHGGITEDVLHRTRARLLVIPGQAAPLIGPSRRILVPLDGSPNRGSRDGFPARTLHHWTHRIATPASRF